MWSRKRLVQIEMNDVDSHITGARHPYQRIHIGAVHVNEPACVMDNLANLLMFFSNSPSVFGFVSISPATCPPSQSSRR